MKSLRFFQCGLLLSRVIGGSGVVRFPRRRADRAISSRPPPSHTSPTLFHLPFLLNLAFATMGAADFLTLLVTHPNEFRTLCQFWLYHEQKRDITSAAEYETSGYDRPSMKRCWYFLDMTSRSFSAVIKELDGDLARVVSIFSDW